MTDGKDGTSAWLDARESGRISIRAVTEGSPFCAGILVVRAGRLLCTLGSEGLPAARRSQWRVGGVGGGQEPGEDIWQCALREAREELGCPVDLVSSPITYLHDIDSNELMKVECAEGTAPFCLQRRQNPDPTTPFRSDLPAGPHTYFALFLARLHAAGDLTPGDDAELLLNMPLDRWHTLRERPTLDAVIRGGAEVISRREIDRAAQLWLPAAESLTTVAPLLARHPELTESIQP